MEGLRPMPKHEPEVIAAVRRRSTVRSCRMIASLGRTHRASRSNGRRSAGRTRSIGYQGSWSRASGRCCINHDAFPKQLGRRSWAISFACTATPWTSRAMPDIDLWSTADVTPARDPCTATNDHRVGASKKLLRHGDTERPGGLEPTSAASPASDSIGSATSD
jgi:hypothetical protein